jgi:CheY-like chemotaxis protein
VEVLLVEDSAGDVLLTQQLLTEAAVPVKLTIARDGEQALTILGNPEFRPAMIILDLNLPGLSGFDVLERNPRKEIPVVIFSGSANPTDADRSLSLGAREYVVKPLGMADYRNAVVGMVRNWAMSEEASNAAARSDLTKRKRISVVSAGSSSGTTYEVVSGMFTANEVTHDPDASPSAETTLIPKGSRIILGDSNDPDKVEFMFGPDRYWTSRTKWSDGNVRAVR